MNGFFTIAHFVKVERHISAVNYYTKQFYGVDVYYLVRFLTAFQKKMNVSKDFQFQMDRSPTDNKDELIVILRGLKRI